MIGPFSLERVVSAVEKVRQRLLRAAAALRAAHVPYAIVGGNAVALWVSRVDEAAVRNTQDVDILIRREDFDAARAALERTGFTYRHLAARGETPAAFGRRCIPAPPHRARKTRGGGPGADCVAPPSNIPDIAPHRAQDARWGPRAVVVAPLRRGPHGADCAPWGGTSGRLAALGATPDFHHGPPAGTDMFLDGPVAKPRDAVHVVFANEKVKAHEPLPNPDVSEAEEADLFRVISLEALVRIKLTAFRDKDRTHLRDLIDVGLVGADWLPRLPPSLVGRLRQLLDTPEG